MKNVYPVLKSLLFHCSSKACLILLCCCLIGPARGQVNTGGNANTSGHQKQVIGYITNWDAWKAASAGVPSAGTMTHLNIDYSKYTILNYSFFGVASDGSLHSGDLRNKNIYQEGATQEPGDIFYTDIYSSWDMYLLFGEIEAVQYVNQDVQRRAQAQGFEVEVNGTTWSHPVWGLSGSLPLPLHKEGGAPGILALAREKGVKVMASIGGWSMGKHFPEMAADPAKRARFVADCKKLIAIGFDGIDLDWEYPGPYAGMNFTGSNADFSNFAQLVEDIRAAIGSDKLITAALPASPDKLQGYDWPRLANSMDYFNLMTYDYNGGWSNKAGHNAPVYSYSGAEYPEFNWQSTLEALTALGVSPKRINFGIPFYGRGVITEGTADVNTATVKRAETVQPDGPVQTAADFTNWPSGVYDGTPNYFYIKQQALAPGSGWTRKWDNEAKVPYLVKGEYFLSYDDEESIEIKARFINDNNLAGTIIWTVYGDLEIKGTATSYGTKLKKWSDVSSPLVNTINEVFADGGTGGDGGGNETTIKGGTLMGGPFTFDIDGVADRVSGITLTGNIGANSTWVVTDNQGKIITLPATLAEVEAINFDDIDATVSKIWHLSYEDGLQGAAIGNNTSNLTGTFDLSNALTVTRSVPDGGGEDSCPGVAEWSSAQVYTGGSEVKYNNVRYQAKWWTQGDNPAQKSGRDDVWKVLGPCGDGGDEVNKAPMVSITSPVNGSTYVAGSTLTITANASDSDGSINKVTFFSGNTELGNDTTSPYSFALSAVADSYTIKAVATDNEGASTTSAVVTIRRENIDGGGNGGGNADIPDKILVGYWHNFNNGSTTPRLGEVSGDWDVICVAFAEPKGSSSSDMQFSPFSLYGGNKQAFISEVALLQSKGQKVLISIGGANARVELNDAQETNEFVSSMTSIINTYGFDGLDIDLEGSSLALSNGDTDFRNPTTPKINNLIAATKAIRNNVGDGFILSMAPETAYVQGGYGSYSGIFGAYLPVIHGLRNELNYVHVQHYNTGSMFGRDGIVYQPGTADFHAAMAEMLITGFPVAQTGLTFSGLRADQVAIGLPATSSAAGSGFTPEALVQQALDYLIRGVSYPGRTYNSAGVYPDFRGIMTWSINWDLASGSQFSSSHRRYLDGLPANAFAASGVMLITTEVAGHTNLSNEIRFYPNPVSGDKIHLSISNTTLAGSDNFQVQVFNTNGVKMIDYLGSNLPKGMRMESFDISKLGTGVYYYTITLSSGKTSGKFIKQ